jgi:hypothetical protein
MAREHFLKGKGTFFPKEDLGIFSEIWRRLENFSRKGNIYASKKQG